MNRKTFFLTLWVLILSSADVTLAQTNLIYHRFRIFLHPDLSMGLANADLRSRLVLYAQDLNLIFGKNTIRRLSFDPNTDLTITDTPPDIDYFSGTLPETNYELWAIVKPAASTPYPFSHGGYMSFSTNGAGVAAGLYWDAVYDRNTLVNADPENQYLWNYWIQLDTLAHEFGHVFGAGVGEYYSLRNVPDNSGLPPFQDIHYGGYEATTDPYWSQHPDYWKDPMLVWTPRLGWADLTNQVRFANVTAAMINAGFRSAFPLNRYTPDLSTTRVWVTTDGQTPVASTPVKAWKVMAHSPFTMQEIFDGLTDANGSVQFAWSGEPNNEDNLMLIKAWPTDSAPMVRWFSFYDAEEQRMVFGKTNLDIFLPGTAARIGPSLAIRQSENVFVVGWPADAAGYVLETSKNLNVPDWALVNQQPTINGSEQSVIWTNSGGAQFFRLRKQ